MNESSDGWNRQHEKYAKAEWIGKPTIFGEWALQYFPSTGRVLDAGCGQGQDSKLFASKGYDVVAADFSDIALRFARDKMPDELKSMIDFQNVDLSKPLPFPDNSFEVVYSHMASHYFDAAGTAQLFDEYYRVLKPGGVILLLVNSIHDPELSKATKIEDEYYAVGGMQKRFFSADSMRKFASKFEVVVADESGETYKDRAVGNSHLVRLVAKKT